MAREFDCVLMKRRGARLVRRKLKGMTREEELAYWQEGTRRLRERQLDLQKQALVPLDEIPLAPGAYRLLKGDEIVYVGTTANLRGRLNEHAHSEEKVQVRRSGWDRYEFLVAATEEDAEKLSAELQQRAIHRT